MERLGHEIERELRRSGSRDAVPLQALTAAWPEVVGDAIARQAWPLRIARDGTLHVATSSSTWAHELAFHGDEILGRLRERLGSEAPAKLKCAVGPVPETASLDEVTVAAVTHVEEMPAEVVSGAAAVASAIADPELRELVARAARASLLRARSGRQI